ncbi:hypothetical protein LCM27_02230 [Ruegeria marisrubri]|uniref:hypothetical protein n=1 Tax=Ruegeria marisrubri TaxID=1685379 RepID=UPI001CD34F73|nr:hypothetical protein [Ruegeria marisrubri]MCA0905210.1 hypothetical protein [Ruegeria marisrubri]
MKKLSPLCFLLLCFGANASFSDVLGSEIPVEPVVGIEDWFDGCAELTNTTRATVSKHTLDQGCAGQALYFCLAQDRSRFEERCQDILISHLSLKSAEISASLPSEPDLSASHLQVYTRTVQDASSGHSGTCIGHSELYCRFLHEVGTWVDWRHAQRLVEGKGQ